MVTMSRCCRHLGHDLVVLVAASSVRLLFCGLWYTPGILYVAFRDAFQQSAAVTSWITSLQYFTSCITGAVGGLVMHRFGSRLVTVTGGIILSGGLLTSMWTTHIAHLFVTYGMLAGFGAGLCYIGCLEAVKEMFTTNVNLVFGVSAFIANLGIMIYPPVLQLLIDIFSWRGMFLILAGVELNIIVIAAVFPGPHIRPQVETPIAQETDESNRHGDTGSEINDGKTDSLLHGISPKTEKTVALKDISLQTTFLENHYFLKSRHYYLYVLSGTLYLFGAGIILGHLSAYAMENNITDSYGAAMLYTVNALSMACGKLLHGVVITKIRMNPIKLHIFVCGIGGLATFLFLFNVPLPVLYAYMVVFGASNASIGGALMPSILLEMAGSDSFSFSVGFYTVITAMGSLIGAPTAGWIYDATSSYTTPFLLAAISMISSAFVMVTSCQFKPNQATTTGGV
ncbi:monocarboxylate transporter 12-like isoform X1 [Haliotis rufescens]|uniref:monocarboxylate transporter 12-like isoform X1 n=2 Tax=Haliotis rufescens TaxID=6454 RepID=UPI00201EEC5F|nr:monocarboxylate transporter 12-like isoform X1 [Haliotis rufescens]XP_048247350.1 monocarboxylate transporter 12-like isoform X1 [Haliotis rufescens]XP_048247351.1 monocarboxylate transporter 12-like isoform X1 [Haliotis rufescens]